MTFRTGQIIPVGNTSKRDLVFSSQLILNDMKIKTYSKIIFYFSHGTKMLQLEGGSGGIFSLICTVLDSNWKICALYAYNVLEFMSPALKAQSSHCFFFFCFREISLYVSQTDLNWSSCLRSLICSYSNIVSSLSSFFFINKLKIFFTIM